MFEWPPCIEGHSFLSALLRPGNVVLDFGLNQGRFALEMIKRFQCVVYGAEPASALYDRLPRNDYLKAYRVALTGTEVPVKVNVYTDLCASIYGIGEGRLEKTEIVAGCTLRGFLELAKLERADLAKVDIEGAEIELFNNASDGDLRAIDQYAVEFHDFMLPQLKDSVEAIKSRMSSLGYVCLPFTLSNCDVLFVKRSLLKAPFIQEIWLRGPVRFAQGAMRRSRRLLKGYVS